MRRGPPFEGGHTVGHGSDMAMPASFKAPQDLLERLTHVLLFVLGHAHAPTLDDWYRAVDDQFDDVDEAGKQRIVEAAIALLREGTRQPDAALRSAA